MRLVIVLSALLALPLIGCKKSDDASATSQTSTQVVSTAPEPEELVEVSVADAATRIQNGAVAVDANSDRTRKKHGTVPNAVILTSSSEYDLSLLPEDKDKDLIFYCSNTFCTASDTAAERAAANGYENVSVMREGIKGWKNAGNQTASFPQS